MALQVPVDDWFMDDGDDDMCGSATELEVLTGPVDPGGEGPLELRGPLGPVDLVDPAVLEPPMTGAMELLPEHPLAPVQPPAPAWGSSTRALCALLVSRCHAVCCVRFNVNLRTGPFVRLRIGQSAMNSRWIGVFADEPIAAGSDIDLVSGTRVWVLDKDRDRLGHAQMFATGLRLGDSELMVALPLEKTQGAESPVLLRSRYVCPAPVGNCVFERRGADVVVVAIRCINIGDEITYSDAGSVASDV